MEILKRRGRKSRGAAFEDMKRRSGRSRGAFEDTKRGRIGISEYSQPTTDEIEVAGILSYLHYFVRLFLQWGAKRRRSTIQKKKSSTTHRFKLLPRRDESENAHGLQHGGLAMAPSPERSLPLTSCISSKNVRAKNQPEKRAPRKKTHKELIEMVDELSLENTRLIKEVEQGRKTHQGLKDYNVYLKSQVTLWLEQQQEKNMACISLPSSSSHSDSRQETQTAASCDIFQSFDKHGHFEKCSGSSIVGPAYDKPQIHGRPMYPCSAESSFGFEKDVVIPTKDTGCSGFLHLNTLDEAVFGTNISNDLHDQTLMPKNKTAVDTPAEARRHGIEVKRGKYPQLSKGQSRGHEDLIEKKL